MDTYIKRIDLTRDYEAHREEYLKAIEKVCRETAFSGGKYADAFDRDFAEYVGVPYACGVNNGTSALHLAMLALGVGPGDEVIVPANTYIATAWGVSYTGATPVFADCTPDTWEIDPSGLEAKITPRTKGILGVHLYGQPFDYAKVRRSLTGMEYLWRRTAPRPTARNSRAGWQDPWEKWGALAFTPARISMLSGKAAALPAKRKPITGI